MTSYHSAQAFSPNHQQGKNVKLCNQQAPRYVSSTLPRCTLQQGPTSQQLPTSGCNETNNFQTSHTQQRHCTLWQRTVVFHSNFVGSGGARNHTTTVPRPSFESTAATGTSHPPAYVSLPARLCHLPNKPRITVSRWPAALPPCNARCFSPAAHQSRAPPVYRANLATLRVLLLTAGGQARVLLRPGTQKNTVLVRRRSHSTILGCPPNLHLGVGRG